MKPGVKSGDAFYDLDHGFLQIFPDSLRAETLVEAHAQHTHTHFTPQHWLLCHMGLY